MESSLKCETGIGSASLPNPHVHCLERDSLRVSEHLHAYIQRLDDLMNVRERDDRTTPTAGRVLLDLLHEQ